MKKSSFQTIMRCHVLISTYWNVNTSRSSENGIQEVVLISTYWNVNERLAKAAEAVPESFNLNLLECKFEKVADEVWLAEKF